MNLTSVRYQDSCIYIGVNGSQDREENEAFQQEIRNAYVVYKIKALGHHVQETVLLGKRDIFIKGQKILLKIELIQLLHPEKCEFEIISLKMNFVNGECKEMNIGRSFKFLEIQYSTRIEFPRKKSTKKCKMQDKIEKKNQDDPANTKTIVPIQVVSKNKKFEEKKISPGGFTIVEEITPVLKITENIESKIQSKLDAQTKELDMDIRKLCLETIDLLLANLPLPILAEEYRASSVMVNSIHKYINTELLENYQDGDESA